MKKKILLLLTLFISIFSLASCGKSENEYKNITCNDVIEVYKKANYEVYHYEYNPINEEDGMICFVRCNLLDSPDLIFFNFFESDDKAESYKDENEWNIALFVFSCVIGYPTWLKTKTYNNIEVEYSKNYLYEPFKELL